MNKKIYIITLFFFFLPNIIFANINTYENMIVPNNDKIGKINFGKINSQNYIVHKMFKEEYTQAWIENYVSENFRHVFTNKYSELFLDLLPISSTIYCSEVIKYTNNNAISIIFEEGRIITLLFDKEEDKIIGINLSKYFS